MIEVSVYYPTVRTINEPSSDIVCVEFVLPKRPFLSWCEVRDCEALQLPKGYGVVWYDFIRKRYLYAPMPFNVLLSFGIWFYNWVRYGATYWMAKHKPN